MSDLPTTNAYAPSASAFAQDQLNMQIGGFTKFILIVFIVFGALGTFGGCIGVVQTVIGIVFAGAMDAAAAAPEATPAEIAVQDAIKVLGNPYPGAMFVALTQQIVMLLASVAMGIGGIMGMQGKRIGLSTVRWTSAFMVLYKCLETAYAVGVISMVFSTIKSLVIDRLKEMPEQPEFDVGQAADIMLYVVLAMVVLWGLFLIALYSISYLHTSKANVQAKFK